MRKAFLVIIITFMVIGGFGLFYFEPHVDPRTGTLTLEPRSPHVSFPEEYPPPEELSEKVPPLHPPASLEEPSESAELSDKRVRDVERRKNAEIAGLKSELADANRRVRQLRLLYERKEADSASCLSRLERSEARYQGLASDLDKVLVELARVREEKSESRSRVERARHNSSPPYRIESWDW